MAVEVRIPSLGESVSQGVISRWLKKNGDTVAADEALFELETDKATMEIPAETAGRLEILKPEGAEVSVGTVVARIAPDGAGRAGKVEGTTAEKEPARKIEAVKEPSKKDAPSRQEETGRERRKEVREAAAAKTAGKADAPLAPSVRRLVSEHDLDPSNIAGTGRDGRLTKGDVLEHLEKRGPERTPAERRDEAGTEEAPRDASGNRDAEPREGRGPERVPAPGDGHEDGVERRPMTRLRQRIAERLVEAQRTAAILTTFNEIDMSAVMELRKQFKERFEKAHGVGLGFMSIFGRAVILALRDVPVVNARIDGTEIVFHRNVHLGIAVGTERGLVVPVVRNADGMTIADLERAIGELAGLARSGKLLPDHLAGGTFTISNGGVYGSLLSTPILNPPQSGILGMHKIEQRPVVVDGQIVARPMMYVALSYDHRLVDGEQAVTFLVRVKERLEDPVRMLLDV
jgi:2-oxoglutarate dehydrogenase E2 component (dihydrolipoamide succinyltransferase)